MSRPNSPDIEDVKQWLRREDTTFRIIAAEMMEFTGRVNLLWSQAINHVDSDPTDALAKLIDVEILLENHLRIERQDMLAVAKEASSRLAAALPTNGDE
jgi:hypothetical protein